MEELLLAGALDGVLDLLEAITRVTAGIEACSVIGPYPPAAGAPACMSGEHGCRRQYRQQGTYVSMDPDHVFFTFTNVV